MDKANIVGLLGIENLEQEKLIEFRKLKSESYKKATEQARSSQCMLCGKNVTGFCNSHSLPQFILKNIETEGIVKTAVAAFEKNTLESDLGVKSAGIFKNICRACDKTVFQKYENIEILSQDTIGSEVLNLIALKNVLKIIDTKKRDVKLGMLLHSNYFSCVSEFDLLESEKELSSLKCKLNKDNHIVVIDAKLDYIVPIAFQSSICLAVDLEGQIINNLFSMSKEYKIVPLYVAVFPLNEISRVIVFYNKNSKRYRNFAKQIRKLTIDKQLAVVNFIIFRYSDAVYTNFEIVEEVKKDPLLCEAISTLGIDTPFPTVEDIVKIYSLENAFKTTNFLLRHYANKLA